MQVEYCIDKKLQACICDWLQDIGCYPGTLHPKPVVGMRGGGCLLPIALLSLRLNACCQISLSFVTVGWPLLGKVQSSALLTPWSPREVFLFNKLHKHESVELLHKLNLSCSSLRNVLSWSCFFFFQVSSLSVFYITFLTPCKILLLPLELNLANTFIIYCFSSAEQDSFIWQIFQCFV